MWTIRRRVSQLGPENAQPSGPRAVNSALLTSDATASASRPIFHDDKSYSTAPSYQRKTLLPVRELYIFFLAARSASTVPNSALCVSGGSRWLVSASGNRAAAPVWTRTIREIMSVMDLTRRCRWLAVQFGASSEPIQYALLKTEICPLKSSFAH